MNQVGCQEKQHQRRLSFRLEEEEEWEAVFVSDMSVVELLDVGRLVVLMKEEGAAEVEEAEEEEEENLETKMFFKSAENYRDGYI